MVILALVTNRPSDEDYSQTDHASGRHSTKTLVFKIHRVHTQLSVVSVCLKSIPIEQAGLFQ